MITYNKHVRCKCGGIISCQTLDDIYSCEGCGKTYVLWKLDYDLLEANPKTGRVFPMKRRDN